MNPRFRTGLVIAIVGLFLIVLGVFLAMRFLNLDITGTVANKVPPTPVAQTTVSIAFAVNDIPAGALITPKDVKLSEIPIQFAPQDTISNLDVVVGKISKTDLAKGQMILGPNLANPTGGAAHDVAYVLDEKHVLIAMPATDLMSQHAIVQRGDIVDILVSAQEALEPATKTGDTQTTSNASATPSAPQLVTFDALQKTNITALVVDVVKADNKAQDNTDSANLPKDKVVVQAYLLAMDPQDALVIKYLKDIGANFEFVIRAPTSTGQFEVTPVTDKFIKELYGLELLP